MNTWFEKDSQKILEILEVNAHTGLGEEEIRVRKERYGSNELIDRGMKNPWKIILEQLTGLMIIILIIAAAISLLLGETTDAIAILVIVILNAVLGFSQEYRAEKAMAALKKLSVPKVRVRRIGKIMEVSAQELVPGDIVLIEAGNAIPADGSLIQSSNLRIQESVLTGESEAVEKSPKPIQAKQPALGDQTNRLFMGTIATYGRGEMVVSEIGMQTELGKIAEMIQTVGQESTPLQRRLDQLGKGLAVAALIIVAVVFGLGLMRGEEIRLMFLTAISMAVAAIPEGLPAVVTIALAFGAQRMLKRQSLIRKLPAVETLGSVDVICSDKTGTLTQNRMTVTVLDVAGSSLDLSQELDSFSPTLRKSKIAPLPLENSAIALMLLGGSLCNDAVLEEKDDGDFSAIGDPTEGALVIAAAQAGLWKSDLDTRLPRIGELPFDSERKRMTTVHQVQVDNLPEALKETFEKHPDSGDINAIAFTKGSVDGLLECSNRVWVRGTVEPMTNEWHERILKANDDLAKNGMRVLGIGFRKHTLTNDEEQHPLEENLIFIGMVAMIDPARPEVKTAVRVASEAGIRPIMITGDHPLTALYIARELGITNEGKVMTGQELAEIDMQTLRESVHEVSVFARVSPEHKLRIVEALQDQNHIVAMTGDGVNDAPALKKADIGVAMGITGTDVSKEAADMVLLDDNFATIIAAVEEGRRIYDNIRKFIKYTLTSNAGEIWVMLLGPFMGLGLPLLPLQILWVNLVTDGLPGLALTVEPVERNTMKRKPYHPDENIFGRGLGRDIIWIGLLMGLVSLVVGLWGQHYGTSGSWQTMVFTTLTLAQMGNAFASRSQRDSIFRQGFLSNKLMFGAVLLTFIMQMAVVYFPPLQSIFKTTPLHFTELMVSLGASVLVFFGIELGKYLFNRKQKG
ncbi:MAG: cation-translocating P-type ATPase [Anaerolineaceae bacterium]|nr:cation-translocating P-type ATPase [Anaerolineaceae bacterium]